MGTVQVLPHKDLLSAGAIEERPRLEGRGAGSTQGRHIARAGMRPVGEAVGDSGDRERAVVLSRESLARARQACLEGLAAVALAEERLTHYLGLTETLGELPASFERDRQSRDLRVVLAPEAGWCEDSPAPGQGTRRTCLSDQTVEPLPDAWGTAVHRHDLPKPASPAGLTPREVEVLRLIAAGRTSKEIAIALVISVPTVERHVTNLYRKIGARGRAAATAYALRNRLVPADQA